jgi:hypothetical protein
MSQRNGEKQKEEEDLSLARELSHVERLIDEEEVGKER